jgi:hypothetical protein
VGPAAEGQVPVGRAIDAELVGLSELSGDPIRTAEADHDARTLGQGDAGNFGLRGRHAKEAWLDRRFIAQRLLDGQRGEARLGSARLGSARLGGELRPLVWMLRERLSQIAQHVDRRVHRGHEILRYARDAAEPCAVSSGVGLRSLHRCTGGSPVHR